MQNFLRKMAVAVNRFMIGRYGVDELSQFTIIAGLAFSMLDMFLRTGVLSILGTVLYIITLLRIFSRDVNKRREENRKYLYIRDNRKTLWKQFVARTKGRKDYKYFRCPGCKALMRLHRGSGEREMTCPGCKTHFKQKA